MPLGITPPNKLCENRSRNAGEKTALGNLHVPVARQFVDVDGLTVVPPDLRNGQSGVDGELLQRRAGGVDFDNDVWWRIGFQVDIAFAYYSSCIRNVVTAVGLGPFGQRPLLPCSAAQEFDLQIEGVGKYDDHLVEEACVLLVLGQ